MLSRRQLYLPWIAAAVVVVLAACGNGAEPTCHSVSVTPSGPRTTGGTTPTESNPPTTPIEIGQALEAAEGSEVTVSGFLIVDRDGITRLCSLLAQSYPPQCGGDRIDLLGFDASSVPDSETPEGPSEIGTARWTNSQITVTGIKGICFYGLDVVRLSTAAPTATPPGVPGDSQVVTTVVSAPRYVIFTSFEELEREATAIVIGTGTGQRESRTHQGRGLNPDELDPNYAGVGVAYQVEVERYLKGAGPDVLLVYQNEGSLTIPTKGRRKGQQIATVDKAAKFPIREGVRYLFFLRRPPYPPRSDDRSGTAVAVRAGRRDGQRGRSLGRRVGVLPRDARIGPNGHRRRDRAPGHRRLGRDGRPPRSRWR